MRRQNLDTSLRYIALLRSIPVYPRKISVADISNYLKSRSTEYSVDTRTLQRDLEKLSRKFPITCDTEGRKNFWFWTDKNDLVHIPAMSQPTALAFNLAEEYLKGILPGSTIELLAAYFNRAREVLKGSKLMKWSKNIRSIKRGPYLEPPRIHPAVQETIYEALLNERQVNVNYLARGAERVKEYVLNPLSLVARNGAIYLVATAWRYEDPRHFMLSRIRKARLLDEPASRPNGFNLDAYVQEQGEFAYPLSNEMLRLELLFSQDAGFLFFESRLSSNQVVSTLEDGRIRVTATVRDDAEIRWWLLGYGDQVEVVKPQSLREEFRAIAKNLQRYYR